MANYSVSANQLTEGTSVHVRGKLAFARLTRLIEGDELAKSDQRKVQNGMNPVGKPHTTATITEAEVVFADPANPTIEEQFVSERRYASKKNPDSGANYSIDSKGTNLPIIAIPSENGNYDQDLSGQELAQGVDVTLVLRVYKPKGFSNRGLALDQVIVNEAPRYYNGGGVSTADLAARGIVFNAPPKAVQAQAVGASTDSAVGGADLTGTVVEDGFSFPAPQPSVPMAAPAAPVHTAPAQVQAQPAAAPAPAAASAAAQAPVAETVEQKLARLEAENRAMKDAGGSAVGAPVSDGPWNQGGQAEQAGITFQG